MEEHILKILEAAIQAPSGDNCQPWRFSVNSSKQIDLYDEPSADTSYYNYRQRASLVAHGALLENIALVAPTLGFNARFKLFPVQDNSRHVAQITLDECLPKTVDLEPFISLRSTNRKRYRGGLLDESELASLVPSNSDLPNVSVVLKNKRQDLDRLSGVICLSDRLVFENQRLHQFLFNHIRWSDKEAARCRDGLDIKTLELNKFDTLGFKLLRNWSLTSVLSKLGVSKAVAHNARQLACSASAIGVVLGNNSMDPNTYLQGGRLLQRVWLQATKMGLSFHPMAGICFLMQRVAEHKADELSHRHIELIRDALGEVALVSGNCNPNVISIFRVGMAEPPSVRSKRKELSQVMV